MGRDERQGEEVIPITTKPYNKIIIKIVKINIVTIKTMCELIIIP